MVTIGTVSCPISCTELILAECCISFPVAISFVGVVGATVYASPLPTVVVLVAVVQISSFSIAVIPVFGKLGAERGSPLFVVVASDRANKQSNSNNKQQLHDKMF
jgi:hypothetical protein